MLFIMTVIYVCEAISKVSNGRGDSLKELSGTKSILRYCVLESVFQIVTKSMERHLSEVRYRVQGTIEKGEGEEEEGEDKEEDKEVGALASG